MDVDIIDEISPPSRVIQDAVDTYLSTVPSQASVFMHVGAIYATSFQERYKQYGSFSTLPLLNEVYSILQSANATLTTLGANKVKGGHEFLKALNDMNQALSGCNIDGIPVLTASVDVQRTVDVSSDPVISLAGEKREVFTKSATPRLRTWSIKGYLKAGNDIDTYYYTKPTLVMQADLLDAMASSRRPVLFKDNNNRFFRVQITNFSQSWTAESSTAVAVNITLQEWRPIVTQAPEPMQIAGLIPTTEAA